MKKFPNYILIIIISLLFSCRGQSKTQGNNNLIPREDVVTTADAIPSSKINYNIFVDNSYSMDGYISNPSTEFKTTLMSLASDINANLAVTPSFYFISNKPCLQTFNNSTQDLIQFIARLTPDISKKNCKPKNSRIDDMIDSCTKDLDNNVSIIVSDCVFSENTVGREELEMAKSKLKVSISQKLAKSDFSSIILKYHSNFSGSYYVESNSAKPETIQSGNRPFYMLIFGKSANLSQLFSKINFKAYKNFENSYCLLSGQNTKNPTWNISFGNIGRFKTHQKSNIEDASAENSIFQFSINIDLRKLGCEESFLMEPSNYSVNEGFKVVKVSTIAGSPVYTHNIVLSTNTLKQSSDLIFGLKYDLPEWVNKTATTIDNYPNDTAQQKQTFGLGYLMKGLSAAFIAKNGDLQFLISIKVNKKK